MGKKGNWFSAVKKALSPEPKEKRDQKPQKSKKKWFGKNKDSDPISSSIQTTVSVHASSHVEDVKLTEAESEQSKHAYSVAIATAVAAEAAVAAAQAAAEIVRLTSVPRFVGKSNEEVAAIKIQTAFRGHMARRALRALRGLVRLKSVILGQSVKRQATTTLKCMQTLARVQSQIRERRIKMSEVNEALQRQLLQKHEKELEKLRALEMGEEWDDSIQSKEKVDANLQSRQDAAMRRERALAYAFTHQQMWKNSSKSLNPTFMDPNNPHWGWSWLERWMASRPWEIQTPTTKQLKSSSTRAMSAGEINKAYSRRDSKSSMNGKLPNRPSPSTPTSKAPPYPYFLSSAGKIKSASPKGSAWGGEDDSRSTFSIQSERYRRHSIAGSSVRDDESMASLSSVPSYMAPTQSAKAKSRVPSPFCVENVSPDKGSAGSVKKRLSFAGSPARPRRHSGPPKIDTALIKDVNAGKG